MIFLSKIISTKKIGSVRLLLPCDNLFCQHTIKAWIARFHLNLQSEGPYGLLRHHHNHLLGTAKVGSLLGHPSH